MLKCIIYISRYITVTQNVWKHIYPQKDSASSHVDTNMSTLIKRHRQQQWQFVTTPSLLAHYCLLPYLQKDYINCCQSTLMHYVVCLIQVHLKTCCVRCNAINKKSKQNGFFLDQSNFRMLPYLLVSTQFYSIFIQFCRPKL